MNTPYTNTEAEEYFQNLADNKEALNTCFQYICNTLDEALASQDYTVLLSLIPYIESGEGHLAFEHIGETRRILRILNIIALEHKYLEQTFASDCFCMNDLMAKYYLTLFAYRRILFQLSDTSIEEAIVYLQDNVISHFAAYVISSEELMLPTSNFYESVIHIYAPYWSPNNMQQFRLLIQKQS